MIPKTKNEAVDQSLEKWLAILSSEKSLGEIEDNDGLCYYSYQRELFHIANGACLLKCPLAKKYNACNENGSIPGRINRILDDYNLGAFFLNELKMHREYSELKELIQGMICQLEGLKDG